MAGEDITAIAGLVKTAAGAAGQFGAADELGGSANDLIAQARNEALARLQAGQATSRLLTQRADAALEDVSFLQALSESHQRTLFQEELRATGKVQAEAAGSGVVSTTGSPLLAQLDTSIEFGKQMAGQQLTAQVGERRLRFEAEQDLERAGDVIQQSRSEAQSALDLRAQQAASLRQKQRQTILGGIDTLTNQRTINTLDSLFAYTPGTGTFTQYGGREPIT